MEFFEQYKHPMWQKKRLEAFTVGRIAAAFALAGNTDALEKFADKCERNAKAMLGGNAE